jgi:hypothetical protein
MVAYACNPSYLGGWDWKDQILRPARTKKFLQPHLTQ